MRPKIPLNLGKELGNAQKQKGDPYHAILIIVYIHFVTLSEDGK
jgi:hypothetical protein